MLWLLVNKFAVLEIKEYISEDSDSSNVSVCTFHTNSAAITRCYKWQNKLLLYPIMFFIQVLVDSRATGIFINYGFIEKHCIDIYKLY